MNHNPFVNIQTSHTCEKITAKDYPFNRDNIRRKNSKIVKNKTKKETRNLNEITNAPNQTSLPDVLRLEVPSNSITYKLIKNKTKQKGQKTPLVTHEVDYSPIPSLQNPKPFESNADHNLCKEGTKNNHRTNWA